jgi:hypothetical protein
MLAVFIGYDIPEALDTKWTHVIPILDKLYKVIDYEGDTVHVINGESDINFIKDLLVAYNILLQINLTLDVFTVDESLLKF